MRPQILYRLTEPEFPPLAALGLDCEDPADACTLHAKLYRDGVSTPAFWLGKALLLAMARWRDGGLDDTARRDVRRVVWDMEEFAPARLPFWLDREIRDRGFFALRGLVDLWTRDRGDDGAAEERGDAIPPAVNAAAAIWEEDAFRFAAGCFAVDRANQGARTIAERARRRPATRSPAGCAAHVLPEIAS